MAQKQRVRVNMNLDKVERNLVAKIKAMKPEYADLEPYQVAKMELRNRLFDELRKLNKEAERPQDNAPLIQRSLFEVLDLAFA